MPLNNAQFVAIEIMCESLLHGIFTVLIVTVLWIMKTRHSIPTMHRIMFGISIVMYLLAAVHLALVVLSLTDPAIAFRNNITRVSIATVQFMLGDFVLIWRVWVVWGGNYWIAAGPFITTLIAAGFSFGITGKPFSSLLTNSVVPTVLIAANTIVCTSLIAGRIWYMLHHVNKLMGTSSTRTSASPVRGAVMLIIESGAIWTTCLIIDIILDRTGTDGTHIMNDLQIPLEGILPTLIIILVHFDLVPGGRAHREFTDTTITTLHAPPVLASRVQPTAGKPPNALQFNHSTVGSSDGEVELDEWKVANASGVNMAERPRGGDLEAARVL